MASATGAAATRVGAASAAPGARPAAAAPSVRRAPFAPQLSGVGVSSAGIDGGAAASASSASGMSPDPGARAAPNLDGDSTAARSNVGHVRGNEAAEVALCGAELVCQPRGHRCGNTWQREGRHVVRGEFPTRHSPSTSDRRWGWGGSATNREPPGRWQRHHRVDGIRPRAPPPTPLEATTSLGDCKPHDPADDLRSENMV